MTTKKVTSKDIKAVKDMGWAVADISLQSRIIDGVKVNVAGFGGAVAEFQSATKGAVAVVFTLHEAYILEDNQGLFGAKDLNKYVLKSNDVDFFFPNEIEGTSIIATELNGDVVVNRDVLARLGLENQEVIDDISRRLVALADFDIEVEMKLS